MLKLLKAEFKYHSAWLLFFIAFITQFAAIIIVYGRFLMRNEIFVGIEVLASFIIISFIVLKNHQEKRTRQYLVLPVTRKQVAVSRALFIMLLLFFLIFLFRILILIFPHKAIVYYLMDVIEYLKLGIIAYPVCLISYDIFYHISNNKKGRIAFTILFAGIITALIIFLLPAVSFQYIPKQLYIYYLNDIVNLFYYALRIYIFAATLALLSIFTFKRRRSYLN